MELVFKSRNENKMKMHRKFTYLINYLIDTTL